MCSQSMVPQTVLFWLFLRPGSRERARRFFSCLVPGISRKQEERRHGREVAMVIENWQI